MTKSASDKTDGLSIQMSAPQEVVIVSDRDFARILDLLDNPPKANAKLRAAIAALPKAI